ncbi:MAG: helix-turn-helix transcriptional regulator [Candidatus Aminicenantes bacterium]|nr:MAG: helix-turn-helix transcriptional regulator [Candidatus Aminicenantes bacterium]
MKKKFFTGIGKRLVELRKVLGIQQNEMADQVGMQSSYLCDLENGNKSNPGITQLYRISKKYGVSLDYLVLGEGEMFLPGKQDEEKKIDEFIPSFEGLADLTWLLKNSNFFKNLMLSQASKLYFENEEFIKMEIKRLRGLTEKPTPETERTE